MKREEEGAVALGGRVHGVPGRTGVQIRGGAPWGAAAGTLLNGFAGAW